MSQTTFDAQPNSHSIVMTRRFAAPPALVYKMMTDPELIPHWWGPSRLTTVVDRMEPRTGGSWRFVQRDTDGNQFAFHGVYHDMQPAQRTVSTFEFEGMPGHVLMETVTFEEQDGGTLLTNISVFQTPEDRDGMLHSGMQSGATESMDRLGALLTAEPARAKASPMRTFFSFNMMSLDGFFEGPGASLDWHRVDEEFGRFALEQLASIDTLVFGRRTYEMMAAFWTSAEALKADPLTAEAMNSRPKLIFSRTLKSVGWHNSRLAGPDLAAEINALKAAPGRDIALFGSAALMAALAPLNVIDEHRVMINPLLLGAGTPLFQGPAAQGTLRLLRTRTFGNGNILLSYAPAA